MGMNHAVNEELLKANSHYKRLAEKHSELESELKDVSASPSIDASRVKLLKQKKLHLADQMASIESAFS